MIGDIRAYNDAIYRRVRRELGSVPIPLAVSAATLRTAADNPDRQPGFSIPYVGRERVKGFKPALDEPLFVDISGFGSPGEPALTMREMLLRMLAETEKQGTLCWGLVEVGQFQGYLMAWKARG